MGRSLTSGWITEGSASSCRPVIFFEGTFQSQMLNLWNGIGNITWNAKTWLGNGWIQGVSGGEETLEVQSKDIQIVLTGVAQNVLRLILGELKQGASGKFYMGFLDNAGAVIVDPYLFCDGKFDTAELQEGGESASVILTYETFLVNLDRNKEYRYTKETQRIFFPTDLGFDYVETLQEWSGFWGTFGTVQDTTKKKKKKKR